MFENTFIVKKQKHCNFCGDILPYPTKFTFARKCKRCSMKNSTLLLPARFLCNMCIDHSANDLHQCQNDQIPLESIKHAKSLQSGDQIMNIQKVISQSLTLFLADLKENTEYYQSPDVACIAKASQIKYLYSNVLTILVNRMLKLLAQILKHRLPIESDLQSLFQQIAGREGKMTKSFALTSRRI